MTESSRHDTDDGNSEFGLIARLAEFGVAENLTNAKSILTGIGDDTAVVTSPNGNLLLTTDAMVDGVHFRSVDERWFDIGWKCAVSNLSDIAAMGGIPDHALVTLGVPKGAPVETYVDFYSGMNEAFGQFGGRVVGGDVVSSPTMFVNLALTGHTSNGANGDPAWFTRSTAQAGDLVCVTGPLGSSAGGLEVLLAGETNPSGKILVDRHFRPTPRIKLGQQLIAYGVRCAMDVSDGLVGDLEKIADQSKVEINLMMADIPLAPELIFMFGTSAIELALSGGEDYELVFTAPEQIVENFPTNIRESISVIGKISNTDLPKGIVKIFDSNGDEYEPIRKGWDHLNG
ncbi:thiamine-phosphate kinase [Dehalococcoides mccartyi]|nr:thiamine-phosphate kinase [Dehalococcoides mccartyi]